MSDDLRQYLDARRARVEHRLERILAEQKDCPASLREAMEYSLLAPGKRLRPLLVLLAHEAAGGAADDALAAACAIEMVHTYSLIHDDLPAMDDDDLRRGRPTCHKQFGEALAILAGDALLTLAFGVLAESYPPWAAAACCRELARGAGACGMVGGQVEDLAWARLWLTSASTTATLAPPQATANALERVHASKTGALFRACLRIGVHTAQAERADPGLLRIMDNYGCSFGLVFQITDDLLDVEGNTEDTGKGVHKDAARGKLTYPGLLGVAESRRRAGLLADQARDTLRPLGPRGDRLAALLQLVLERDR